MPLDFEKYFGVVMFSFIFIALANYFLPDLFTWADFNLSIIFRFIISGLVLLLFFKFIIGGNFNNQKNIIIFGVMLIILILMFFFAPKYLGMKIFNTSNEMLQSIIGGV